MQFSGLFQLQIAIQHLKRNEPDKYVDRIKKLVQYCDDMSQQLSELPGQDRTIEQQQEWLQQLQDQLNKTI